MPTPNLYASLGLSPNGQVLPKAPVMMSAPQTFPTAPPKPLGSDMNNRPSYPLPLMPPGYTPTQPKIGDHGIEGETWDGTKWTGGVMGNLGQAGSAPGGPMLGNLLKGATPASGQSAVSTGAWNVDVATAIGQLFGYLHPGQIAQGGVLDKAVAAGDPAMAAEFNKIRDGITSGSMNTDQLTDYFVNQQIQKSQADPTYGSLAKPSFKAFKPFALSDYIADPGYQFRKDEGQKAIDHADAARGGFYSGAALKEASKYNSDQASQEYGNAYGRYNNDFSIGYGQAKNDSDTLYSRLAGLTQTGSGATNTAVNANQNNANAGGNIYGQVGNATAGATLAQGSNNSNILSQILGNSFGRSSYGASPTQLNAGANGFRGF